MGLTFIRAVASWVQNQKLKRVNYNSLFSVVEGAKSISDLNRKRIKYTVAIFILNLLFGGIALFSQSTETVKTCEASVSGYSELRVKIQCLLVLGVFQGVLMVVRVFSSDDQRENRVNFIRDLGYGENRVQELLQLETEFLREEKKKLDNFGYSRSELAMLEQGPVNKQGLNRMVLSKYMRDNLASEKYSKHLHEKKDDHNVCWICLMPYQEGQRVKFLNCWQANLGG